MTVAKKIKPGNRMRLRRPRPKASVRRTNAMRNRPDGYFKDALTPEEIEQDNRIAQVVAGMNARHSPPP